MKPSASSFPPAIPRGRVFLVVLAATAAAALLALAGAPLDGAGGLVLLGAAVALTGMPHGAIDHLVARRLFGLRGVRGHVVFYGGYLACAALYGAGWWIWPKGALVFFVLMAVYHFGQADLAHLMPTGRAREGGLYLSRGLFVVGSPLLARPGALAPILEAIAGVVPPAVPPGWGAVCVVVLAGQHVLALWLLGGAGVDWRREGAAVTVLTGLFLVTPPLAAFAVYFGLWHALGHVFVLMRFFRAPGEQDRRPPHEHTGPRSFSAFYRQAALYTLLPLVGLGGLLLFVPEGTLTRAGGLAALFILISVLTLPHMLLVERLYRREREEIQSRKGADSRLP